MYSIMNTKSKIIASNIPTYELAARICKSIGESWIISPSGGVCKEYLEEDVDKFHLYQVLMMGNTIEYNKLILTTIKRFGDNRYQVYCDYAEFKYNDLFLEAEEAINLFLKIKTKLKNKNL